MTVARPRLSGQFIAGERGPLAMVVWKPPPGTSTRFGVLHVPACGDELNKSRRVLAVQARELARRGGTVALVDLRGMGDSGGEHGEATWAGWHADAETAWQFLSSMIGSVPVVLWGLRLGSLLAVDLVASKRVSPDVLLLWQPVVSGRTFFGQWLRLASTQRVTGRTQANPDAKALRAMLASGSKIQIAGYELHPELVCAAEAIDLDALPAPRCPVVWLETTVADPEALSPVAARLQSRWTREGASSEFRVVSGPSFWASQELSEAPDLVASTTTSLLASLSIGAEPT